MSKIKVTQQQRDNLLDAMNNMWPSVPEANVARRLGDWCTSRDTAFSASCRTVACFGGWCACWPAFIGQGVKRKMSGAPCLLNAPGGDAPGDVSEKLFGYPWLFMPRDFEECDFGFTGSDHALVTNRLQWLLDNSEVAE